MQKQNIISRKFWNKRPCNIRHSKKKIFSKEYFNEVSRKRYFVEKHIKDFVNFKKWKNKNILEIGFGIGTDAIEFLKNGAKYNGIELSDKSHNITSKRIKIFNYKAESLIFDEAEKLSNHYSMKNNFHLIYSFGVLHHSSSLKKCLSEIYKIMNSKTELKIMLYAKNSYKYMMMKKNLIRYEAQKNVPVIDFYTKDEIRKLFKKFKIVEMKQDFVFPYKIKYYKKNKYVMVDHFKNMPKKIFNIFRENLGEHLLIKAKKK